jgi:hypothetical protein
MKILSKLYNLITQLQRSTASKKKWHPRYECILIGKIKYDYLSESPAFLKGSISYRVL